MLSEIIESSTSMAKFIIIATLVFIIMMMFWFSSSRSGESMKVSFMPKDKIFGVIPIPRIK